MKKALWVLMAAAFVDMMGFAVVFPLLPFYALRLGAPPWMLGLLIASFSVAQLAASPIWGRVSDRYGRRPVLLIGLAALLLLTPLGILAVGTAWGEWSPSDFPTPALPQGLGRLATVWTAPFPDYAPPFLRSASFGYMLSAVFGAGLILLAALLADRIFARRKRVP